MTEEKITMTSTTAAIKVEPKIPCLTQQQRPKFGHMKISTPTKTAASTAAITTRVTTTIPTATTIIYNCNKVVHIIEMSISGNFL